MTASVLDDVPGLGPARRKALLRALRLAQAAARGRRRGDRRGARASAPRTAGAVVAALAGDAGGAAPPSTSTTGEVLDDEYGSTGQRAAARTPVAGTTGPCRARTDARVRPTTTAPTTPRGAAGRRPGRTELLIVTGMSGAGRSTAADGLEDLGWYVVDNLPPQLLPRLAELRRARRGAVPTARRRWSTSAAGRSSPTCATPLAGAARARASHPRVLFLDATDEALVRRFESVRRPHPLQGDGRILDGIAARARAARRPARPTPTW